MESLYIEHGVQDSRQSRSRDSHLSSTAADFQALHIRTSSAASSRPEVTTPWHTNTPTSYFGSEHDRHAGSLVASPAAQTYSPFPQLSQSDLGPNWSSPTAPTPEQISTRPPPLLRLDSSPEQYSSQHSNKAISQPVLRDPAKMSTMGIQQYDARFDSGMRQSYTWPHFEMPQQYIPQDMNPGNLTPYDVNMPIYSRSLSSSPPRACLTPEQRELKRQRDQARRCTKTRTRKERTPSSNSNTYVPSQGNTPEPIPRSLPDYQTLTSAPHMAHSPLIQSPGFIPAYSPQSPYPPHMGEATPTEMYTPVFTTMGSNDFEIPSYHVPYSSGEESSIQSYVTRPHSMSSASDAPSMYQSHHSPSISSPDSSAEPVRVVHSRPKPQCWEHGCNGRQFSTFSNLLRHQREKSGVAAKSTCPHCGAEFTRTTARNGHMLHDKCKQRRYT
ncbi:hypothetical protein BP5796_07481 [Coleophoma crateriformis]|uniref:C2H2-type domain-containing protein n=1 Tax=Coleophoma crateriformis TaxID=565419 RepID=A0A3D8RJ11_9HELO|nr:hypothetical protein BP5796_07481 [Coleophoma crateriformis]